MRRERGERSSPFARSSLICLLIAFSTDGVSPKGKTGGMRLCQTSTAGIVSKKGFFLSVPGMNSGFVADRHVPRPAAEGWSSGSGRASSMAVLRAREGEALLRRGFRVDVSPSTWPLLGLAFRARLPPGPLLAALLSASCSVAR